MATLYKWSDGSITLRIRVEHDVTRSEAIAAVVHHLASDNDPPRSRSDLEKVIREQLWRYGKFIGDDGNEAWTALGALDESDQFNEWWERAEAVVDKYLPQLTN